MLTTSLLRILHLACLLHSTQTSEIWGTHLLKVFTAAGPSLFFREWSLNKLLGSTNLLLQHHYTATEQLKAYFAMFRALFLFLQSRAPTCIRWTACTNLCAFIDLELLYAALLNWMCSACKLIALVLWSLLILVLHQNFANQPWHLFWILSL